MAERRKLKFHNIYAALADLNRLKGGYEQIGKWTLPQICFHVRYPIEASLKEATTTDLTPEQKQAQQFIEQVIAHGWPQEKQLDSPQPMRPPADAKPEEIKKLADVLVRLASFPAAELDVFYFGPVQIEKFRRFVLAHIEHHFSFLIPTARRRVGLKYADEEALTADLNHLRKGYQQTGTWNLPQICWHLANATEFSMRPGPFPPLTPEQIANRPRLLNLFATGQLPGGIESPPDFVPSFDCKDCEVDHLIEAMLKAKNFPGPFAPHRIFGELTPDEARKLRLMHCAHHLSHLTPTQQES